MESQCQCKIDDISFVDVIECEAEHKDKDKHKGEERRKFTLHYTS